jgi:hypothetical protein
VSEFQLAKMWLLDTLQLGKDALHIYVALIVFFGACLLFRWKASQWKPWLCVLAVALAGEALDLTDNVDPGQLIDLVASLKDLVNTLLAPTVLVMLARHTTTFEAPPPGEAEPMDCGDEIGQTSEKQTNERENS